MSSDGARRGGWHVVSSWRAARALVVALAIVGCIPPLPPQLVSVDAHPPRPPLRAGADTNDPKAYVLFGEARLGSEPDSAAAAFWWAAHLDPWWAEPVYARAVALLASRNYSAGARARGMRTEPERDALVMATVDSLMMRASSLDPFYVHTLDYVLTGRMPKFLADRMADPADGGFVAFNDGDFAHAAELFGKALAKHPGQVGTRFLRAQAFYHLAKYDSAAAELTHTLDTLSARDTSRKTLAPYRSKEMLYFALGTVQLARKDTAAAREAYEQALVENLGFAMARVRLAGIALAAADTAGAVRELDAALFTAPDDPALHYFYGQLLASTGQTRQAIDHLLRAVSLDPEFAAPHAMLGRIAEAIGEHEEAADEYAAYLRFAPLRLDDRAWVAQRLASLRGGARP